MRISHPPREWKNTVHNEVTIPLAWDQILALLFIVFNPLKVIGPFATITRNTDKAFNRQLAWRAILFSAISIGIAGIMGQRTLMTWGIRQAILLLAGGIIWFLLALLTVLQPYLPLSRYNPTVDQPSLALALKPLAFPTIVTPYGVATFIVLLTTMQTLGQIAVLLALTAVMLLLNWVIMVFARPILDLLAVPLELISSVLGVLQVALGLDLIYIALRHLW
jgi:multiple antibiotic resistance protein